LENEGWITRRSSLHDRRCKMVFLGQRAQRVISQINAAAEKLRHELLEDVSAADLRTCVRVLTQICEKAEGKNGNGGLVKFRSTVRK
jgi:MarR family transcriptional regulator for hemolysin